MKAFTIITIPALVINIFFSVCLYNNCSIYYIVLLSYYCYSRLPMLAQIVDKLLVSNLSSTYYNFTATIYSLRTPFYNLNTTYYILSLNAMYMPFSC